MEHDLITKDTHAKYNLKLLGEANSLYYVGAWWREKDTRGNKEESLKYLKLYYPYQTEEVLLRALETVIAHPPDWFRQPNTKERK